MRGACREAGAARNASVLAALLAAATLTSLVAPPAAAETKVTGDQVEVVVLAHRELAKAVHHMVGDLPSSLAGQSIYVTADAGDASDLLALRVVIRELEGLAAAFAALQKVSASQGKANILAEQTVEEIPQTEALLGSLGAIYGMLKTDVDVSAQDVDVTDETLLALVAAELGGRARMAHERALRLATGAPTCGVGQRFNVLPADLVPAIDAMETERRAALKRVAPLPKDAPARQDLARLETARAALHAALAKDREKGRSLASRLLAAEELACAMADGAAVLEVRPVDAGGSNVVRTGMFAANRVSNGGAAIIAYRLFGSNARLLQADVVFAYGNQRESPVLDRRRLDRFDSAVGSVRGQ